MTIIPQPTLYNQSVLNDEDFVANFVARSETLQTLCRRLLSIGLEDDGQHQIVIGARGMGKTSLLRRLAIEVHRSPDLSARFIPLLFREEQYNVLSPRDFWRNCGESLAEWAELQGLDGLAARLDIEVFSDAWESDDGAAEKFETEMNALGKRAILLIDNLDLILDALKKDARWQLRSSLQARGGPILVGAATQSLREASDRKAAFYEFFQPYFLDPLELLETETCMRALAKRRGEAGRRVIRILRNDRARLRVLHRLTGGNPRVLALTYRLLETADSHSAMADLERLLDEVTPYYKARVEEYQTPLQRAIIDAIALHWDPVTTGELSTITGIPTTTLSPQLSRLRKDGFIEKTKTSGSYVGHQIVERFLNIWYLMRHGTRRTKQRMRWLVAFLSSFYTKNELAEIDQEAREAGHFVRWTRDYAQAFEQAMKIASPQQHVKMQADVLRDAGEGETVDPVSPDTQEALDMVNKGVALRREGDAAAAIEVYDALIARYGDSDALQMQEQVARAMVNKGITLGQEGDAAAEIEVYDALIARYGDSDALQMQEQVAWAKTQVANRLIDTGTDLDRAEAVLLETEKHNKTLAYGNLFWLYLSTNRLSKARDALNYLDDMPQQGCTLMASALALMADNFGEASELLALALDAGLTHEEWDFTDDLERLLRVAIENGFGARLIDWFEKTHFADRYAPIQAALKAAVNGEDQLLDTNPEIRDAAALILRSLLRGTKPSKDI